METAIATHADLYEEMTKYKSLLDWKGRHAKIKKHLDDKGIPRTENQIRNGLNRKTLDVEVAGAVIELGKEKSQKIKSYMS